MNRFFLTILACIIASANVLSQTDSNYRPLAKEGRSWVFRYYGVNSDNSLQPKYLYYTYSVQGDTTINAKEYKKLYMRHSRFNEYTAALRDEGCRAYIVPVDSTREYVFYDLEAHDNVQLPFGCLAKAQASSTEKLLTGEQLRVREFLLKANGVVGNMLHRWIECIGSDEDYFKCQIFASGNGTETLGGYGELVACYDNGICIYGDASYGPAKRTDVPLVYEAQQVPADQSSDIWVEFEEGFFTIYLRDVTDKFSLLINGEKGGNVDLQDMHGTALITFATPDKRYVATLPEGSTLRYAIESDRESFSFDYLTFSRTLPVDVITDRKSSKDSFFDLTGRRLTAQPEKGVYIMDGKKMLAKKGSLQ